MSMVMTTTVAEPETSTVTGAETMPPYNVVLLNDGEHSVDYVIRMLSDLFGHSREKGAEIAQQVHTTGRAVVATTDLEEAELKRDQIHGYGPDPLITSWKGSTSAAVETPSG